MEATGRNLRLIDSKLAHEAHKGRDTIPVHLAARLAVTREKEERSKPLVVEHGIPNVAHAGLR